MADGRLSALLRRLFQFQLSINDRKIGSKVSLHLWRSACVTLDAARRHATISMAPPVTSRVHAFPFLSAMPQIAMPFTASGGAWLTGVRWAARAELLQSLMLC